MSREPPAPWEIYSKSMWSLKQGWPMWAPEPESEDKLVEIGSVIFPTQFGNYRQLFNASKSAEDPINADGVPVGHEIFQPTSARTSEPIITIQQNVMYSRTICSRNAGVEVSGGAPTIVPAGGALGFKFTCTGNQGAVLILEAPAHSIFVVAKRYVVTYMRRHFDSWLDLARSDSLGLDLKPHELLFVTGTSLTSKWWNAAIQGESLSEVDFNVRFDLGNLAGTNIVYSSRNQVLVSPRCQWGPTQDRPNRAAPTRDWNGVTVGTQCIFIHYWKMKKRWWRARPLEAAAGSHNLPPGEDPGNSQELLASSPISSDDSEFEEVATQEPRFDPVDIMLDYILEHSEAEIAIGTDRDIIALFQETEIPEDLYSALVSLQPPIDIDEDGVGTIAVNIRPLASSVPEGPFTSEPTPGVAGESSTALGQPPENMSAYLTSDVLGDAPTEPRPIADPSQMEVDDDEAMSQGEAEIRRLQKMPAMEEWQPPAGGHTGAVTSLAVSPDSRWIASGSDDTTIILWDARDQTLFRKWESHGDIVWDLAFSPNNKYLASAGAEGRVMVWPVEVADGEEFGVIATLEGHTETIHSITWSPDCSKLASGSDDMTVRIWDCETYQLLHLLEGHNAMVLFTAFSPDGKLLASGGADYNCRLWDVETGEVKHTLTGHNGMVWTAVFDPEGRRVATSSDDGSVRIWNVQTGEELVTLHEHQGPVWVVAFSLDGREILSASSDSTVKVCDSFTSDRLLSLDGHDSLVNGAQYSPDNLFIASASSDNTVRLWRRKDGECVTTFNEHNDKVTLVAFSPDGRTLSSGSDDGTVRIRVLKDWVPDYIFAEGALSQ